MMKLSRYGGNPNVGVFSAANENFAFIASDTSDEFVSDVEEALDVRAIKTTVAGSFVVGSLVALNSNGAIVSGLAEEKELALIRELLPVALISDKLNAAGNNILVNDNGAIVNREVDARTLREIEDALGVECVKGSIAGLNTVGSVCKATNKGAIIHPEATDADIKMVKDILKVDARKLTLNHGCRFVAPCLVANSKGAVVGDTTMPIEMGKLEDALNLY